MQVNKSAILYNHPPILTFCVCTWRWEYWDWKLSPVLWVPATSSSVQLLPPGVHQPFSAMSKWLTASRVLTFSNWRTEYISQMPPVVPGACNCPPREIKSSVDTDQVSNDNLVCEHHDIPSLLPSIRIPQQWPQIGIFNSKRMTHVSRNRPAVPVTILLIMFELKSYNMPSYYPMYPTLMSVFPIKHSKINRIGDMVITVG